VKERV
jgi:hypothetical protein